MVRHHYMSRGTESSHSPQFLAYGDSPTRPFHETIRMQQMTGISLWAEAVESSFQYAQFMSDSNFFMGRSIPKAREKQDLIGAPGFLTNNLTMAGTGRWLERSGGHQMHFAPIGINLIQMENLEVIEKKVMSVVNRTGKSARVAGHSAGGMLGFIATMHLHEQYKNGELQIDVEPVSHLYTFGSPVSPEVFGNGQGSASSEAVKGLAEIMMRLDPRGDELQSFKPYLYKDVPSAIKVTNYYSERDRIVSPSFSIRDDSENIEVGGTHSAMTYNKKALQNMGESLAA